jgi:hypothetical protein
MSLRPVNGPIIAVDFDGTLVAHRYPGIGEDIGAVPYLRRAYHEFGARLILLTMRDGSKVHEAVEWCNRKDLAIDAVNTNIDRGLMDLVIKDIQEVTSRPGFMEGLR